jgi:hypothetical protein
MGVRGRVSAAESLVVIAGGAGDRPPPPSQLSGKAAAEWVAIVSRMPPDWFPRETHPMLVQLCRLVVTANDIDRRMRKRGLENNEFQALFKMQREVSASISQLSTRMRISQQSQYDRRKRRGNTPAPLEPWNDTGDGDDGSPADDSFAG